MGKNVSIEIEKRDLSVNPRQVRATGKIPATIYGHGFEPVSVQLESKQFITVFKGDRTALLDLKGADGNYNVLVKNVQYHPTNDTILNIEFQRIRTDEKIRVSVPLMIVGASPAVKAGAVMRTGIHEVEVECLPADIPNHIDVDISGLESFEDSITVAEVKFPSGVAPITSSDTTVVRVSAPKAAAEETLAPETGAEQAAETVEAAPKA